MPCRPWSLLTEVATFLLLIVPVIFLLRMRSSKIINLSGFFCSSIACLENWSFFIGFWNKVSLYMPRKWGWVRIYNLFGSWQPFRLKKMSAPLWSFNYNNNKEFQQNPGQRTLPVRTNVFYTYFFVVMIDKLRTFQFIFAAKTSRSGYRCNNLTDWK